MWRCIFVQVQIFNLAIFMHVYMYVCSTVKGEWNCPSPMFIHSIYKTKYIEMQDWDWVDFL